MKVTIEAGDVRVSIERPDIQGDGRKEVEMETYHDALDLARHIVGVGECIKVIDSSGRVCLCEPTDSVPGRHTKFQNYAKE